MEKQPASPVGIVRFGISARALVCAVDDKLAERATPVIAHVLHRKTLDLAAVKLPPTCPQDDLLGSKLLSLTHQRGNVRLQAAIAAAVLATIRQTPTVVEAQAVTAPKLL